MAARRNNSRMPVLAAAALAFCALASAGGLMVYLEHIPLPKNEIYCKVMRPTAYPGRGVIAAVGISGLGLVPRDAVVQLIIEGEEFHTRKGLSFDRVAIQSNARTCFIKTVGRVKTPLGDLPDCPKDLALNETLKRHQGPCPG